MATCPACSAAVSPKAKFCPSCGEKLKSRAAPEDVEDLDDESVERSPRKKGGKKKASGMPVWLLVLLIFMGSSVLICPCLIALLLPAVQQAREAARRTQARNHMKQMGLAMHNFHDTYRHFPPLNVEGETQPGQQVQSWMTDMLPYLEQGPLHSQVQYGLSWNDPGNKQAFGTVVPTYLNPSEPTPPINSNGYAVAHFAANSYVISENRHSQIREFIDGTSNTMLMGTVDDGFKPWGDPTNSRDPGLGFQGGPNAFGSRHAGVVIVLMADGSVRMVSKNTDPEILKLLGDPADNQVISDDLFAPQ